MTTPRHHPPPRGPSHKTDRIHTRETKTWGDPLPPPPIPRVWGLVMMTNQATDLWRGCANVFYLTQETEGDKSQVLFARFSHLLCTKHTAQRCMVPSLSLSHHVCCTHRFFLSFISCRRPCSFPRHPKAIASHPPQRPPVPRVGTVSLDPICCRIIPSCVSSSPPH